MDGRMFIAEVLFYFRVPIENQESTTVALVSVFSPPDAHILEASSETLWIATYRGDLALRVIDVKTIISVVAMIPLPMSDTEGESHTRFFLAEKPGLDISCVAGHVEHDYEMTTSITGLSE